MRLRLCEKFAPTCCAGGVDRDAWMTSCRPLLDLAGADPRREAGPGAGVACEQRPAPPNAQHSGPWLDPWSGHCIPSGISSAVRAPRARGASGFSRLWLGGTLAAAGKKHGPPRADVDQVAVPIGARHSLGAGPARVA